MASLKLGNNESALESIFPLYKMSEWISTNYKREQSIFLYAICNKILERWTDASAIY